MTDEVKKGLGETSEETRETLKEVLGEDEFNNLSEKGETSPEETPKEDTPKEDKSEEEPREEVKEPEPKEDTPEDVKKQEDEPVEEPKTKRSRFVPVNRYNELRKEIQDLKQQLSEKAQGNPPSKEDKQELDTSLKALAEEYNVDETFVDKLSKVITEQAKSNIKLPDNLEATIKSFQEKEQRLAEDQAFEEEFETLLEDYPDLEGSKADFKRLAFTEGYENTPLNVLATFHLAQNKPNKTAEAPKQGQDKTEYVDFENITEEELKDFDDEQLEQYMAYTKKKAGYGV